MKLDIYQVDAFTTALFKGNPAAVCPLRDWLDDALLQAIAAENNLSETVFFKENNPHGFDIRWFTPITEVDLCGHATLAAAHVLFRHLNHQAQTIRFESRSGQLSVAQTQHGFSMDFPVDVPRLYCLDQPWGNILGVEPEIVLAASDYLLVYSDEGIIQNIQPNFMAMLGLELRGVIITAPGDDVDFVSRFFAPKFGIQEDPVTGSAHCQLAPYWARRLSKERLMAKQISPRGGNVECQLAGDRVFLEGNAVTYLQGNIFI